jgi:RNA polymerase sigma factor (TIGR02999 family)
VATSVSSATVGRDVLRLEHANVVGQALGLEPASEAAQVPRVLRHGMRGPAVGLELDEEAGEGGGDAHGGLELALEVARATVAMDARPARDVKEGRVNIRRGALIPARRPHGPLDDYEKAEGISLHPTSTRSPRASVSRRRGRVRPRRTASPRHGDPSRLSPMADASPPAPDATLLLTAAAGGDRGAAEQLLPLVYEQLKKDAQRQLMSERTGHTLSATALVHEAYLRLIGPREIPWTGRGHFYAAAAEAMRRVLLDHARARAAASRDGPVARRAAMELSCLPDLASEEESAGLLILDGALARLESVDKAAAEVVRLRFFAGLNIEQTASALGVSAPTVKRTWAFARGWLREAIESGRH